MNLIMKKEFGVTHTYSSKSTQVKISLRSPEIIANLQALEAHGRSHGLSEADMCNWMPEYGRWMLEGTPRKPFEGENPICLEKLLFVLNPTCILQQFCKIHIAIEQTETLLTPPKKKLQVSRLYSKSKITCDYVVPEFYP